MKEVGFRVEKETEKAVQICVEYGHFDRYNKFIWLPKSACVIQEYDATVNPCTHEPETIGKMVTAVARWLANKFNL